MTKVAQPIPLRLAPAAAPAPTSEQADAVRAAIDANAATAGALLPILHAVQDALGYVPPAAVPMIANALNQSRAEVHGTLSFYHFFRSRPGGRHVVYLCRAEACQSMGARALERHAMQRLGIGFHETTADGEFTLEPVYCLGNCACSPSVLVDKTLYGRVDPERFDAMLAEVQEQSQ